MRPLNTFGFRVAAVTALVCAVVFGVYWGASKLWDQWSERVPVQVSQEEQTQDRDNDGIADLYEGRFYGTNPTTADTDGDGVSDLAEIEAGRNPVVAGDNDGIKPPTGQNVSSPQTYTQQYLAQLPADIPREEILQQERITAFVDARRGTLLPSLPPETITTTATSGTEAVRSYLDSISSAHNKELHQVTSSDLEAAFRLLIGTGQSASLQDLVTNLEQNVALLIAVPVPQEAAELHRMFVAASQALAANAKLLRNTNTDFVGALIGARNIEELGGVFQDVASRVKALEEKYGLT